MEILQEKCRCDGREGEGGRRHGVRTRSGDVFPSQNALVITGKYERPDMEEMTWGFPQRQRKQLLINARAETIPVMLQKYQEYQQQCLWD